jgi:uncharacterized membrane-anchored protein YitT (DUF2179 family)
VHSLFIAMSSVLTAIHTLVVISFLCGVFSVPCDIYVGMLGGQPAAVARYFGTAVFSVVNIIFLVSSCTVLDSTFASTSKLFGPELFGALLRGKPLPPQMAMQK